MPASPRPALEPRDRIRLTGRRVGIALFAALVSGATLLWTIQILTEVWGSAPASPTGCTAGTQQLEHAVERARLAYATGAADEDERTALSRYREALEPEWSERKAIEAACREDSTGSERLKDVIALRYAEEHAVRYESLGLAPLRRKLKGTSSSSP
jgi:hypothetical protein